MDSFYGTLFTCIVSKFKSFRFFWAIMILRLIGLITRMQLDRVGSIQITKN